MHLILMILHVLGACVVVGVVLLSLFAVIKPPLTKLGMERSAFIGQFGMWASIWQLVTGVLLVIPEWNEFRVNRIFWVKMALYVIEGMLASQLIGRQAKQALKQLESGQPAAGNSFRTVLLVHAGLIVAIAVLGVILVSGGEA